MSQLQDVFHRIQDFKREQKKISKIYRDVLSQKGEYQSIVDEMKTMRERKQQIKDAVEMELSSEMDKLDKIKMEIETDNEMLSDMALNHVAKGEPIKITDKYENEYEPIFKVRFKKVK